MNRVFWIVTSAKTLLFAKRDLTINSSSVRLPLHGIKKINVGFKVFEFANKEF